MPIQQETDRSPSPRYAAMSLIWPRCALLTAALAALLAQGCVGPMGCGPMGCGGPLSLGSGACGDPCNGCGERYIDEWVNHPPDCCDPCDDGGSFTTDHFGPSPPLFRGYRSLWGYRCSPPPAGCDRVACLPTGCEPTMHDPGFSISGPDPTAADCPSCRRGVGHPVRGQEASEDRYEEQEGPSVLSSGTVVPRRPGPRVMSTASIVRPMARSHHAWRNRQSLRHRERPQPVDRAAAVIR